MPRATTRRTPFPVVNTEKVRTDPRYDGAQLRFDILYPDPVTGEAKEVEDMAFGDNDSPKKWLERQGVKVKDAIIQRSER